MEELQINELVRKNLLNSLKWTKFFVILATIIVVIFAFLALACFLLPELHGLPGYSFGIVYLLLILIYIYPLIKAYKLISSGREALIENNQASLEEASKCLHSILKYYGIFTIIFLVLYPTFIIGVIIVGLNS